MPGSKRKRTTTYQPPLPPQWKGRDALQMVYELNERALTLLSEAVTEKLGPWPPDHPVRALWASAGTQVLQRAARFPFVIVDACFKDEAWWRAVVRNPEHQGTSSPETPVWPMKGSEEVLGELLVFAWHTVKWDKRVARLSLGIPSGVADTIGALTPRQLAIISARHASALRLRWQEDPEFWTRLVITARDGDEEALADIQLDAELLL
jgi:hypothetical protein